MRFQSGRVSSSDAVSWPAKRIGSTCPVTIASLVNAVRLATRRMMSNGAMTCSIPVLDNDALRLRHVQELGDNTNLSLGDHRVESIRDVMLASMRSQV